LTAPTDQRNSILDSTKKQLNLDPDYDVFDLDLIMHINGGLTTLNQLGIGPAEGFAIAGSDEKWDAFLGSNNPLLSNVKTYVYLRVRILFDPPTSGFTLDAFKQQIQELEWRISVQRETTDWVDPDPVVVPVDTTVDPLL
jgi:hypothetical protein